MVLWAKARSDEVCDVAGCLSATGSIPATSKIFSILSKLREPLHCTTESFVLVYSIHGRGTGLTVVSLKGDRVHRESSVLRRHYIL